MHRSLGHALIVAFAVTAAMAAPSSALAAAAEPPDASLLVRNEVDFARDVRAHGIRDGFLTWLSPAAVVFRPGPVNGRKTYAAQPASSAALAWTPTRAVLSASGDLGWTTGPWMFKRDTSHAAVDGFGEYVTVWKRQDDGSWRAALDGGIAHESPGGMETEPQLATLPTPAGSRRAPLSVRHSLWEADVAFAKSATGGSIAALDRHALDDVIVLRDGMPRATGREAARKALAARGTSASGSGAATLSSNAQFVSEAGDLGYTYGSYVAQADAPDSSWYVHVWQRGPDRTWKLALDLVLPTPPKPKATP